VVPLGISVRIPTGTPTFCLINPHLGGARQQRMKLLKKKVIIALFTPKKFS
jgi:hypothetical protein